MKKVILTDPEKCTKCLTCVRVCVVNANKVFEDRVEAVPELCLACGDCVVYCPEGARYYLDETDVLAEWVKRGEEVIAMVAPAFRAHWTDPEPGQVVSGLKELGFSEVHEVAVGAELTTLGVLKFMKENPGKKFITSPCPSIVNMIKIWFPELHPYISVVDSPMLSLATYLRKKHPSAKLVFVGPCIAKKTEIEDPNVKGLVDLVLTFKDIDKMWKEKGIDVAFLQAELFDGWQPYVGASYAVSGGLLRTAGFYLGRDMDFVLNTDILVIEGKERVYRYLQRYRENVLKGREDENPTVVDILYCEGCVDGPGVRKDLSVPEKRKLVAEYTTDRFQRTRWGGVKVKKRVAKEVIGVKDIRKIFEEVDVFRQFEEVRAPYRIPSRAEIDEILKKTGMYEHPLNCGACGYETCEARAIAVLNGMMPWDACVQFQRKRLEEVLEEVSAKNRRIKEIISSFSGAISTIRDITANMVGAVEEMTKSSDAIVEASERGKSVLRSLETVRGEVEDLAGVLKDAVGEVSEEIKKLTGVIDVIGNIAGETTLLALNAGIEAARLGAQGRAFEVLAEEIKDLANESEESLNDIKELVSKIFATFSSFEERSEVVGKVAEKTSEVAAVIEGEFGRIQEVLGKVLETMEHVSGLIEEVKAEVDEISAGVDKIVSEE